jgi:hypothetical protein
MFIIIFPNKFYIGKRYILGSPGDEYEEHSQAMTIDTVWIGNGIY